MLLMNKTITNACPDVSLSSRTGCMYQALSHISCGKEVDLEERWWFSLGWARDLEQLGSRLSSVAEVLPEVLLQEEIQIFGWQSSPGAY